MRTIIISAYPYGDRHPHKILFLQKLLERVSASDVAICYLQSTVKAHWKRLRRRFQFRDALQLLRTFRQNSSTIHNESIIAIPKGSLSHIAAKQGVAVHKFSRSSELIQFAQDFTPEIMHNFSGVFLPAALLNIPKHGIISGHYGDLPLLRGGDTIRWSIYLNVPLVVTIFALAPQLDMGDILLKKPVPVYRTDTLEMIRFRCQITSALGQIEAFDRIRAGTITRTLQKPEEGTVFYQMGKYLRAIVQHRLREGLYAHYEELPK